MSDSRRSSVCSKDETDSNKQGTLKSKSSNVNRIVSLFEIARPNKHNSRIVDKPPPFFSNYHKQRSSDSTQEDQCTSSLKPIKSRPNSVSASSVESELETLGNVKRIAARLEQTCDLTNALINNKEIGKRKAKSSHSRRKHKNTSEIEKNQDIILDEPTDTGCSLSVNNTNPYDVSLENNVYENGDFTEKDKNIRNLEENVSNNSTLERERKFIKNRDLKKTDSSCSNKKRNAKHIILSRNEAQKHVEIDLPNTEDEGPEEYAQFETINNAGKKSDTESYRNSLLLQMDRVMAKMREEGFVDVHQNALQDITVRNNLNDFDLEKEEYYKVVTEPTEQYVYDFGETQFNEDLEQGLYFVEAYNIDHKELVIVSMQVDRKSVHVNSVGEIKDITTDSDLHFHQNNSQTLVLINDPLPRFVSKHNSIASSGHYSMDEANSSKRNTIYSTTSGDSFEDFDEGIDLENLESNKDEYSYSSARRETYCDNNGVIRIERVAYPQNVYESVSSTNEQPETSASESVPENRDKLSYIIEEIKETERKYVGDLERVIAEYKPFIEKHPLSAFLGKVEHIFGNIEELYENQKLFLQALENCDSQVENVLQVFLDYEYLFQIYPVYFKSKPRAEIALKEFQPVIYERQKQLNDRLDLSSYLLTPLQRLGRYKLFLESICKQLEKNQKPTEKVTQALDIIRKEMSKGNDAIAIESIFHSPLDKHEYGSFIRREKFTCLKPKKLDLMVFLFQYVIIFTTEDPRNMEIYNYWESIKTNDLRIATFEDSTIHLTDYTRTKRKHSNKYTYIFDAKSVKLKELWRQDIEDILWQQLKNAKENTLKLYRREKPSVRPEMRKARTKSIGSSVFYINE